MLRQNSYAYLHGHSAGGTNPALLEAMSMGKAIVSHNNDFNRHVLDNNGLYFKQRNLPKKSISWITMRLRGINGD